MDINIEKLNNGIIIGTSYLLLQIPTVILATSLITKIRLDSGLYDYKKHNNYLYIFGFVVSALLLIKIITGTVFLFSPQFMKNIEYYKTVFKVSIVDITIQSLLIISFFLSNLIKKRDNYYPIFLNTLPYILFEAGVFLYLLTMYFLLKNNYNTNAATPVSNVVTTSVENEANDGNATTPVVENEANDGNAALQVVKNNIVISIIVVVSIFGVIFFVYYYKTGTFNKTTNIGDAGVSSA